MPNNIDVYVTGRKDKFAKRILQATLVGAVSWIEPRIITALYDYPPGASGKR